MGRAREHGTEWPSGATALVTGAGRRLGRAIAVELAQAGADVVLHCNNSRSEAQALAAQLRACGCSAWVLAADLARPAQAARLLARAVAASGRRVDILVNNASIFPRDRITDCTVEALARNMQVNAFAPLQIARAFAGQFAKPGRAGARPCIVNLLDSRITDYDSEHASYHLSKRALHALTKMMALEFAPRVRVNAVAPGLILPPPGRSEHYLRRLAHTNPLRRFGSSADIAGAVLFLVRSTFITGQVIYVDGGRHLRGSLYG